MLPSIWKSADRSYIWVLVFAEALDSWTIRPYAKRFGLAVLLPGNWEVIHDLSHLVQRDFNTYWCLFFPLHCSQ